MIFLRQFIEISLVARPFLVTIAGVFVIIRIGSIERYPQKKISYIVIEFSRIRPLKPAQRSAKTPPERMVFVRLLEFGVQLLELDSQSLQCRSVIWHGYHPPAGRDLPALDSYPTIVGSPSGRVGRCRRASRAPRRPAARSTTLHSTGMNATPTTVEACALWCFRGCPVGAGRSGRARKEVRRGAIDPEVDPKTAHRAFGQGQNAPVRGTRTTRPPLSRRQVPPHGTGPGQKGAKTAGQPVSAQSLPPAKAGGTEPCNERIRSGRQART